MITVEKLIKLLERVPLNAEVYAYEGEDTGISINDPDGGSWWIQARDNNKEDNYLEGW